MRAGGSVLLSLVVVVVVARRRPDDVTTCLRDVLLAMHRHMSGCVFFVSSEEDGSSGFNASSVAWWLAKSLSAHRLPFGSLSVHTMNYSESYNYCRINSLFVLVSGDNSTRTFLQRTSTTYGLQGPSWLLPLRDDTPLEDLLDGVYVPFHCQFMVLRPQHAAAVSLAEVYHVDEGAPLSAAVVGSWSRQSGVRMLAQSLYERRSQFHGRALRVTSFKKFPKVDTSGNDTGLMIADGYLGEVWKILEQKLNFTSVFLENRDGAAGSFKKNKWNGMVEMVRSKKVDAAVGDLTMTVNRTSVVKYTLPLVHTSFNVYIRTPTRQATRWTSLLAPLSTRLSYVIAASLLAAALVLTGFLGAAERMGGEDSARAGDSLLCVVGAITARAYEPVPRSTSCRMVVLMAYTMSFVVCSAYSASLISSLTKQTVSLPFSDLQGLLDDGTYHFALVRSTAQYNYFQESRHPLLSRVFAKYVEHDDDLPRSQQEGLERLCTRANYAVMMSQEFVYSNGSHPPCAVSALPGEVMPASLGMAFAERSAYTGIVNHNLLKMMSYGIVKRIRSVSRGRPQAEEQEPFSLVDITDVLPILSVLAAGVTAAVFLVTIEIVYGKP